MDVTPLIPTGRQVIDGYGAGGFRIAGSLHQGSVVVFPERTVAWSAREFAAVTLADLQALLAQNDAQPVEILLLGCGAQMAYLDPAIRASLRAGGVKVDCMDTGAACRTFNVLLSEERRVAAALIAVE